MDTSAKDQPSSDVGTPAVDSPAVDSPAVESPAVESPAESPAVDSPAVESPAESPAVKSSAVDTSDGDGGDGRKQRLISSITTRSNWAFSFEKAANELRMDHYDIVECENDSMVNVLQGALSLDTSPSLPPLHNLSNDTLALLDERFKRWIDAAILTTEERTNGRDCVLDDIDKAMIPLDFWSPP
jgi:hypothetical protein